MRKIKFRIWDGNNEKYDYPEMLELNKGLEYEQFTGLHDKNGVEIYEGDLLSLDSWEGVHQISFIDGAFCLAFYKGDYDGKYSGDISYIHHAEREQAKIIGNIHEGTNQ